MIRNLALIIVAAALSGCFTTSSFYVPIDTSILHEQRASCSGAWYADTLLNLGNDVYLSIMVKPVKTGLEIWVRTKLPYGKRLQLHERQMTIDTPSIGASSTTVDLGNWYNQLRDTPANEAIEGYEQGKNIYSQSPFYTIHVFAPIAAVDNIVVKLPSISVDSSYIEAKEISMQLAKKTTFDACVQ